MRPELLWALLGASLGGVGGYGLSKYLNPEDNLRAALMGLGGAGLGAGAGYGGAAVKRKWDSIPSPEDAGEAYARGAASRAEAEQARDSKNKSNTPEK